MDPLTTPTPRTVRMRMGFYVVAGSSMAMVRKLNENHTWLETGNWFRRCAGVLIGLMGIYFIARPFLIEMLNT